MFLTEAQDLFPELKALKDDLHRHPEVSFQERRTTARIKELLAPLGLELIDLGMETGVTALLRGDRPGKTVALRADIDAQTGCTPAATTSTPPPFTAPPGSSPPTGRNWQGTWFSSSSPPRNLPRGRRP